MLAGASQTIGDYAIDANTTLDIRNTRQIEAVITAGDYIDRTGLDEIPINSQRQ